MHPLVWPSVMILGHSFLSGGQKIVAMRARKRCCESAAPGQEAIRFNRELAFAAWWTEAPRTILGKHPRTVPGPRNPTPWQSS